MQRRCWWVLCILAAIISVSKSYYDVYLRVTITRIMRNIFVALYRNIYRKPPTHRLTRIIYSRYRKLRFYLFIHTYELPKLTWVSSYRNFFFRLWRVRILIINLSKLHTTDNRCAYNRFNFTQTKSKQIERCIPGDRKKRYTTSRKVKSKSNDWS